jgi:hypothetical protein
VDWLQFLEIVAAPLFVGVLIAGGWAYRDLRGYIRKVEEKALLAQTESARVSSELRSQMQAMTIEIMKQYVPKDDVIRMEQRVMDAIGKIDEKLERALAK